MRHARYLGKLGLDSLLQAADAVVSLYQLRCEARDPVLRVEVGRGRKLDDSAAAALGAGSVSPPHAPVPSVLCVARLRVSKNCCRH